MLCMYNTFWDSGFDPFPKNVDYTPSKIHTKVSGVLSMYYLTCKGLFTCDTFNAMCHVLLAVSDEKNMRDVQVFPSEHERQKEGLDAVVFSSKDSVMLISVPKKQKGHIKVI